LGYFTERLDPGPTRQALLSLIRGAKRNKAFDDCRWIGLAIDGTGAGWRAQQGCALVHVLTTATLDRLRELYPEGRFEVRRFRPNIVVETANGEKGFVENAWIGQTLAITDTVRLSITGPCPPCVMTTLPQSDLPKQVSWRSGPAQPS
jgi:hypothetical protein